MNTQPMEKRGFIRVPFKTSVEVRVQGHVIRSHDDLNISMSGIHLCTSEAIPPVGTPCEVTITLGKFEEPVIIEAKGKTIRSEIGSLAVEFSELELDSYLHLQQLIINNADDPKQAEQEFHAHWGIRIPRP